MTSPPLSSVAGSSTNGGLQDELARAVRGEVRFDPYTRHLFATDASMYAIEPLGVFFPVDANDIAAAVKVADRFGVPVLPRGAGTSHCGQTIGEAVVLDCSRYMHHILELDPGRRIARVQPGVVQADLNNAALPHDLWFGPDTSTANRATLGGMIGNNSCGSRSVRYGMTIDHVQRLEMILSDGSRARFEPVALEEARRRARAPGLEGRIYEDVLALLDDPSALDAVRRGTPPFWRRAGGYRLDTLVERYDELGVVDLTSLVVSSEGTLGVVTEAVVGLVPRPRSQVIAVGHFESTSAAIAATQNAIAVDADAIEMVDRTILDLSRRNPEHAHLAGFLEGDPDALVFVEFYRDDVEEGRRAIARLEDLWERNGHGYAVFAATTADQIGSVRALRRAGLGLLMASAQGRERSLAFVEDTAVDPRYLAEYAQRFAEILDRHGLRAGFYGHASAGCLHVRPFMNLRQPGQIEVMRQVAEEIRDLVLSFGGVNSSEHGDGLVRSEFNPHQFGDELYGLMRRTKYTFDPDGRMNPGKIVDAPPMTEHLREPALPEPVVMPTSFGFAQHGNLFDAANSCARIGACRKGPDAGGTMCPSYMATRDEQHSTRGRANALVKAMSSPDPEAELGSEDLHEILDLCLECKACKSECPLSVDMATMKSEFLNHYQQQHGVPLRSRLFGAIRRLNELGSAIAPLSNWLTRVPGVRALMERIMGIHRQRPLPRFERENLSRWHRRRKRGRPAAARGSVVLLADSFTSYTETSVGKAAVELLEAAGWEVHLEAQGCCGRPMISKGLLKQARASAEDLVARLAPYAHEGVPIVGCEPSCVLTLVEEAPDLLGGTPDAVAVAAQASLVEDLLLEALDDGSLKLDPRSRVANRPIVYHGHCHQKALVGTESVARLLGHLPDASVEVLDAGCCGMAGSFGFEREHYELSLQIGSQRLFPAIAAAEPETLVVASGVSCRQQIRHGTSRRARHPLEVLLDAIPPAHGEKS